MRPPLNIRKPFMTRQIGCCKLCYCYCGLANTAAPMLKMMMRRPRFASSFPLVTHLCLRRFSRRRTSAAGAYLSVDGRTTDGEKEAISSCLFAWPQQQSENRRMTPKSVIQHVFGTRCSNAFRTPFIWSSGLSRFA